MIKLPEFLDSWQEVLRAIVFFQGCFLAGSCGFIVYKCWKLERGRMPHIVPLAISHIMLTFLTMRGVHLGTYSPGTLHWPIPAICLLVAFVLTNLGLRRMIKGILGDGDKKPRHEITILVDKDLLEKKELDVTVKEKVSVAMVEERLTEKLKVKSPKEKGGLPQ